MKKTLILIIYTLIHTIGAFASVEVDFMYYNLLQDNRAEVVASSSSHYVGDIVVPQTITYAGKEYTVIGIGDRAFQEAAITSLKLPNSIEYIGSYAFYKAKFQCIKNLVINIPSGVTQIGEYAFSDTYKTRDNVSVSVSLGCRTVPEGCFYQSSLSDVSLGPKTKIIERNAFYKFEGGISWGDYVEEIGESAFYSCKKVYTMPLYVRKIGKSAFAYSTLRQACLTDVSEIGDKAFYNCNNLSSAFFSYKLKTIGNSCFQGCSDLSISEPLPLNIENIGIYAFADIKYLYCVNLTPSIQSIGDYAFYNSKLSRINIYSDTPDFNINAIAGYNPIQTIGTTLTEPNTVIEAIVDAKALPLNTAYIPWGCEYEYYGKPNAIFKDVENRLFTPTVYSYIRGGNVRDYGFEWNDISDLAGIGTACSDDEWKNEIESIASGMALQTSAPHIPSVGNYSVNCINSDGSSPTVPVGVALVNGVLEITAADLTVSFATTNTISSTYGSTPEYQLSYRGFVNGETSDVLLSPIKLEPEITPTTLPGTYSVRLTGGEAENYNIYYQGEKTLVVNKASLMIETGDYSKVYGTENPEIIPIYTGFVNDESSDILLRQPVFYFRGVLLNSEAELYTPVGNYPICASQYAESDRYEIDYTLGNFYITKADQHITWEQEFDEVKVGDEITLNASLSSGLPVEYSLSNNDNVAELNGNIIRFLREGSVDINATQPGDSNYNGFSLFKTAHVSVSSGIEDIASDDGLSISVVNCQLIVKGTTDSEIVRVFTLSGATVYEGTSKAISLTSGIYIVQVSNLREKVVVK